MNTDSDVQIITLKPKKLNLAALAAAAVSARISECHQDGHIDTDVLGINKDADTIEIIAGKIHEFEIHAMPGIVLPAPVMPQLSPRRDASHMLYHYNRAQNSKYSAALRNYKGRKR